MLGEVAPSLCLGTGLSATHAAVIQPELLTHPGIGICGTEVPQVFAFCLSHNGKPGSPSGKESAQNFLRLAPSSMHLRQTPFIRRGRIWTQQPEATQLTRVTRHRRKLSSTVTERIYYWINNWGVAFWGETHQCWPNTPWWRKYWPEHQKAPDPVWELWWVISLFSFTVSLLKIKWVDRKILSWNSPSLSIYNSWGNFFKI